MPIQSSRARISDGQYVVVRAVDRSRDLAALLAFLEALPAEVRQTLPYDVRDPRIVDAHLAQIDGQHHWRAIALLNDLIVADASLDREPFGWARHVALFRAVVRPDLERRGLRHLLCDWLIEAAREAGVERLTAEVLADHGHEVRVLERLGFVQEFTRRSFAKGLDGRLHDVLVLSNDLDVVWRQLEDHLSDMDSYFPGMAGRN